MKRKAGPSLEKLDGKGAAAFWARWYLERQEWARSTHNLTGFMPAAVTPRLAFASASAGRLAEPLGGARAGGRARRLRRPAR